MTDTSGKHTELIEPDAERIFQTLNYAGMGGQAEILFGPECEFFICKIKNQNLVPISRGEADDFIAFYAGATGDTLHQEAIASHFELNYGPMNLSDFAEKFGKYFDNVRALYRLADEKGYRIIPSSHAPHIEGADDVMGQLVDRERIQMIFPVAREYLGDNLVKFANLTAGIHVSSGYEDPEKFYEGLRRTYYLSPFIYALSNNGFPFWKGMKDANGVIPRMAVIEEFAKEPQGRTGIDPLFYESVGGEDFLHRYIDRMINMPLLGFRRRYPGVTEIFQQSALMDVIRNLKLPEPGLRKIEGLGASPEKPLSFADLKDFTLNTIANLQFAASTLWYGVKVQDLPIDGENGMPLKRLENRIWNGGTWQLASALLTDALMTQDEDCGREVDALLAKYGFRPEGPALDPQSGENLKKATEQAWKKGGAHGLDFEYGNGAAMEFGREFTAILVKYAQKYGLADYLAPMEYIVRTNETDARVLRKICKTPEDVTAFIENYDVDTLADPKRSFGMLVEEGKLLQEPSADKMYAESVAATNAPGLAVR